MVFRGDWEPSNIRLGQRPSQSLEKHKVGIFRGAVKYLSRIIQQWMLGQFTHQPLQFSERLKACLNALYNTRLCMIDICIALLGKVFKRTIHGLYNHSTSMTKQRIVG